MGKQKGRAAFRALGLIDLGRRPRLEIGDGWRGDIAPCQASACGAGTSSLAKGIGGQSQHYFGLARTAKANSRF